MISPEKYRNWFRQAKPGDRVVYHVGGHLFGLSKDHPVVRETARRAYDDALQGDVFLCQRRVSFGVFEYIAIKLSPRARRMFRSWTLENAD